MTASIAETATLVHGYSMADVERAALIAARRRRFMIIDDEDREQTAWHGVVTKLYECGCGRGACDRTGDLTFYDLILAGIAAVNTAADDYLHHHGRASSNAEQEAPNFTKFWVTVSRTKAGYTDDGFSDQLCERLSLPSVLGVLTPEQYEAVAALAVLENGAKAAEALGLSYAQFWRRVGPARERVARAWFGDETPPDKSQDRCKWGHLRAQHGHRKKSGKWACTKCASRSTANYRRNKAASGTDEESTSTTEAA